MRKVEIGGMEVAYRNVPELPQRVSAALKETQEKRLALEREVKLLRRQERQLSQFLGCKTESTPSAISSMNGNKMNKTEVKAL